ncbi:MAG: hypothetical protein ACK5UX_10500 [Burkholderiales bacterium]
MRIVIALLLLVMPWVIFLLAAQRTGATSTLVLVLTLAVSALGFMMLISRPGGAKPGGRDASDEPPAPRG